MTLPYIVCAAITAVSALTSLGFSISETMGLVGRARVMALYACVRSVALVTVSAVPFLTGSTGWLLAVAGAMVLVQAGDAVVGMTIHNAVKTVGPAVTAVLNLAAVVWVVLAGL